MLVFPAFGADVLVIVVANMFSVPLGIMFGADVSRSLEVLSYIASDVRDLAAHYC